MKVMKNYRPEVIARAQRVLNDYKGDKERALNHFKSDRNTWLYSHIAGCEEMQKEDDECADYILSLM